MRTRVGSGLSPSRGLTFSPRSFSPSYSCATLLPRHYPVLTCGTWFVPLHLHMRPTPTSSASPSSPPADPSLLSAAAAAVAFRLAAASSSPSASPFPCLPAAPEAAPFLLPGPDPDTPFCEQAIELREQNVAGFFANGLLGNTRRSSVIFRVGADRYVRSSTCFAAPGAGRAGACFLVCSARVSASLRRRWNVSSNDL